MLTISIFRKQPLEVFYRKKCVFFLSGFSFTDTDDSLDRRGKEGTIFYSTLPFPPAHEYSDIYLQLCMWDDYHILLIAPLVFTRLLLDEIYHLIELLFDWLMMWRNFCLFTQGFESRWMSVELLCSVKSILI